MLFPEKGKPLTFKLTSRYNDSSTKTNQDRCLCYYDEKTNSLIVGIFDGHGEKGHIIAETIRDLFVHNLINNPLFEDDPLGSMHSAIRMAEETMYTRKFYKLL